MSARRVRWAERVCCIAEPKALLNQDLPIACLGGPTLLVDAFRPIPADE